MEPVHDDEANPWPVVDGGVEVRPPAGCEVLQEGVPFDPPRPGDEGAT
ncbi:MAG TPA: hypothetical protein VIL36_12750 [Acidimicrobiales bacterium]